MRAMVPAEMYFNPRPPRGERHHNGSADVLTNYISIHALREESDVVQNTNISANAKFQSTPSARRATCAGSMTGNAATFQSTPSARRATLHLCS